MAADPYVRATGIVLRRHRERLGLTMEAAAERIGTLAPGWCRYERCTQKDIGLISFSRLAAAMELTATELMKDVEDEILARNLVSTRRNSAK